MATKKKGKSNRRKGAKGPTFVERMREFFAPAPAPRGKQAETDASEHFQEIKGLALIGMAMWLFLSLMSYQPTIGVLPAAGEHPESWNWGGQAGRYLASWVFTAIGWAGYFLVFLAMAWGVVLVARKHISWPLVRVFGGALFLVSSAFLVQLAFGDSYGLDLPYGPGGYLAWELAGPGVDGSHVPPILVEKLGGPGLWILLVLASLLSFMLATEMAFYPAIAAFQEWMRERRDDDRESVVGAVGGWLGRLFAGLWEFLRGTDLTQDAKPAKAKKATKAKPKPKKKKPEPELFDEDEEEALADDEEWVYEDEEEEEEDEDPAAEDDEWEYEEEEEDDEEEEEEAAEITPAPAPAKRKAIEPIQAEISYEPPTPPPGDWKLPPMDLLEPPHVVSKDDEGFIEDQAARLENALKSFRVEATVVGAQVGPAVTLFELEVVQGTRMNKVTQLSQEIAAALRAKSVRIIAPIPGRATIGIEVPNKKRRMVRLSELVHQKAYDKKFAALPLFLGMDAEGNAIIEDLTRMPHLLIAGTTGSGKSVCINTILASLLLTRSPHDIQLILVDPKMVEMQMFSTVPHLMLPVVSDMRQATNVLLWACEKMEGRYELFKRAGVRHIKGYNALGEDGLREKMGEDFNEERTPRHVPYIVIVIDEMADLMMTSKKEAEQTITRLAQKSRAVGIHVIVATQRPSTDVITGVLKGNLPTRIAFQVASKVDSRVILDAMGAEKLLGSGDMLYTPPQSSQLKRVQGALIEDHEIQAIVDFVTQESIPNFNQELVQTATGTASATQTAGGADQDELFDEAVRVILKSRRGSASLLQRALGIGYTRASRLIDIMTAEGIVGEHKGSKAREVLMSLEDWDENQAAIEGANS